MGRNLTSLIMAAGYAASQGQSFDLNVPGSDAAIGMRRYARDGWTNWAQNLSSVAHNGSVVCTFNFTGADGLTRYGHIMEPVQVSMVEIADPGSLGVTLTNQTLNADTQSSITVQVSGKGVNGTYSGGSNVPSVNTNYWDGMSGTLQNVGEEPGPGVDADWFIRVAFTMGSYVPPTLSSDAIQFDVLQPADAGSFNAELTTRRDVTVAQYDAGAAPAYQAEGRFFTDYADRTSTGSVVPSDVGASGSPYVSQNLELNVQTGSQHTMLFDAGPVSGLQYGRIYYQCRLGPGFDWTTTPLQIDWWDTRLYNAYPG